MRVAVVAAATTAAGVIALAGGASPALAADSCPNAQFRTGPSANLPDCRAYEQVSPVNKRGNAVKDPAQPQPYPGWSSPEGNTVLFNVSKGPGTDNAVRGYSFPQVAERTAAGWTNRPAANGPAPQAPVEAQFSTLRFQIPSVDRQSVLFSSASPFTADNPYINPHSNGSVNLARGNAVDWLSKPTWSGASPTPGSTDLKLDWFMPVGGSADLSTSYFVSAATLTPEDGTSGRAPLTSWALYRWKAGQLTNAGVLPPTPGHPNGSLDPGGSAAAGLATNAVSSAGVNNSKANGMVSQYGYTHSVSPDGSGVLFVSPDPKAGTGRPSQLYLARDGQPTVQLSKRTDAATALPGTAGVEQTGGLSGSSTPSITDIAPGVFAVASRDQSVVLFSTTDALTDNAPVDPAVVKTYRYTVANSGSLDYMPDLDRAVTPGTLTPGMVFNVSDDGSRILYRTDGDELKLWREGQSTVTLSGGVGPVMADAGGGITESRFSKDGHTLLLMSKVALAGEPNHPAGGGAAQTQVYRYSEDGGALDCVSCPPVSANPQGPAVFVLQTSLDNGFGTVTNPQPMESTQGMTDDGRVVFFTTTSPLSAADDNTKADVYESRDSGPPQLLSSGDADARGDFLVDNSADGKNVFFVSERALTNSDTDDVYDLYDARMDGGLPDPPALIERRCAEGTCQGPKSAAPTVAAPTSPLVAPVTVGAQRLLNPAKDTAKLRVKKGKSSSTRVTVQVTTPGAGKIRARGTGLKTANRRAKRATTYTVHVKLSRHARSTLRKKGRLTVRVKVRFSPTKGKAVSKTVTVTIKRHVRSSRKGR